MKSDCAGVLVSIVEWATYWAVAVYHDVVHRG